MARLLVVAAALLLAACPTGSGKKDTRGTDAPARIARLEQERGPASGFKAFLADEDPEVRARAVLAVARLEHRGALPALVAASSDGNAKVRKQAAFGLGQLDLALDPKTAGHDETRAEIEARLVAMATTDADPEIRRAAVRALGRVGDKAGLDGLIALAGHDGPLHGEALTALGVAGARRKASRQNDAGLLAAVERGLAHADDVVKAGAAYAAFRQKLKISEQGAQSGVAAKDMQPRVFLMRAIASQEAPVATVLIEAGLRDTDWRVRVEALRAAGDKGGPIQGIARLLDESVAQLASNPSSAGAGHVAREACAALVATNAGPAQLGARLSDAVKTLKSKPGLEPVTCACAVAADIVDPDKKLTESCTTDEVALAKLDVLRTAKSRMSSRERVAALSHFLLHDETKVRMAAAGALAEEGPAASADSAAKALETEADFGVTTTLLELFADEEAANALPDSTLYKLLERFRAGTAYETVEPLVTVAKIARTRTTPTARSIVAELEAHNEPRIRDAVTAIPPGDRAPGPRASVVAAPDPTTLPASATLKTARGDVRIEFDREHAPATVANFVTLAKAKYYDGTPFHRVIADFVAQGGDKRGDGSGGPGYNVACENSDEPYTRGAVGMAHAGKDTGGSQFFLTHSWQPHLDGRYTLFGHVVDGLDVMDAIQPDDKLLGVDIH